MSTQTRMTLQIPTRDMKITNFMDALDDYVSAKIQDDTNNYEYWVGDNVIKAGNVLRSALDELLR